MEGTAILACDFAKEYHLPFCPYPSLRLQHVSLLPRDVRKGGGRGATLGSSDAIGRKFGRFWAQIDPVVGAPLTPNKQTTTRDFRTPAGQNSCEGIRKPHRSHEICAETHKKARPDSRGPSDHLGLPRKRTHQKSRSL